jgi:hypothetical protein
MEQIFAATVTSTADNVDGDGIYDGLPITSCEYVIHHDSESVALDRIYLESVDTKSASSIGGPCFGCQDPNSSAGEPHPDWSEHAWLEASAVANFGHDYEASLEARGRYWHVNASDSATVEPYIGDPPPDPVADQETSQLISMLDLLVAGREAAGNAPDEEAPTVAAANPACTTLATTIADLQPSSTTVTAVALGDTALAGGAVLPAADCAFNFSNPATPGAFTAWGFYLRDDPARAALIDDTLGLAGYELMGSTWSLSDDSGIFVVTSRPLAGTLSPDIVAAAGGVGDVVLITYTPQT